MCVCVCVFGRQLYNPSVSSLKKWGRRVDYEFVEEVGRRVGDELFLRLEEIDRETFVFVC